MTNVLLTVKAAPSRDCKHTGADTQREMHEWAAAVKKAVADALPSTWDVVVTLSTEVMHG